jgi:Putative zinc-finger
MMTCRDARSRFSSHRDAELPLEEGRDLEAHLASCAACADEWRHYSCALNSLARSPRPQPRESIVSAVLASLEVETRGPGLALLFRPSWAARPLILPSLIPAAMVLVAVLGGVLALDQEALPAVYEAGRGWKNYGTDANPLFPMEGVTVPRPPEDDVLSSQMFAGLGEGELFVEAVVGSDGRVSMVTLIEGDSELARPYLDALRLERFVPGRFRGRPVAVSVYRLISTMEVRAKIT